jgi:hypothetical protein
MVGDALLSGWYHRPPVRHRLPSNGRLCTLHSRCAHIGEKETSIRAVERTHTSLEWVPWFFLESGQDVELNRLVPSNVEIKNEQRYASASTDKTSARKE